MVGSDGRVQVINPAASQMLGLQLTEDAILVDYLDSRSDLGAAIVRATSGNPLKNESIQYRTPNGDASWIRVNSLHLTDEVGDSLGTLLTLRDVTDLKRAEREIWQADKMSALGRLAASVAHEVGNPLGAVDIQLQLLQEDTAGIDGQLERKVNRRISIARAEIRRLNGIVQNFLRFSRPPAMHLEQVNVNVLLQNMYALVAPEARERGIELAMELEESLPDIRADENQLSQALLNILINAFQATDNEPRVLLRSRLERSLAGKADANPQIVLEISDNGRGVPEESLEKIFEFYYTTKDAGTGLGLSIAQRIVHRHGGTVEIASELERGTIVSFRLPCDGPNEVGELVAEAAVEASRRATRADQTAAQTLE